jgi:molybdenum cofactor cytidylyltransferase
MPKSWSRWWHVLPPAQGISHEDTASFMNDVAAIILAAGRGTRFDAEPKLLTLLDGKPLVRHVAQAAVASIAEPVIVVTGHRSEEVEAALADLKLRFVSNPSYADGMSTSLKAGFSALSNDAEAAVILLGDMPLIGPNLIDTLVNAWREMGKPAALIPTLNGRRGNPVILSRILDGQIAGLNGDTGAGPILRSRSDVVEYPVDDQAIFQDVDTTEEFRKLSGDV